MTFIFIIIIINICSQEDLEDDIQFPAQRATTSVAAAGQPDPEELFDPLQFMRFYVEMLLPSVVIPRLDEGPTHVRDQQTDIVVSRLRLTNAPRCQQVN